MTDEMPRFWTDIDGTRGRPKDDVFTAFLQTPDGTIRLEMPAPGLADQVDARGARKLRLLVSALDSLREAAMSPAYASEFRDRGE